jgi:uncharacterized protein YodC (DUF2158 family)
MAISSQLPPMKAGDKVRLTAGGAVMSIERIIQDAAPPFARCAWMDPRATLHRAFVILDALELVSADEGASHPP